ncbi:MAG: VTT domain-containing protein [Archaeoglobaceae archaeon]|nr:VTT domain-containing protein [Archaeoglobaceae archaeon]
MLENVVNYLAELRYPGIFLISLISNSIPFIGIPYLNFLFILSPFMNLEETVIVALISAFGASLGKIIVYSIGASMRFTLSEKTKENLIFFEKIFKKWGFFAIFLFAASPLPDDVLYIPLGIAKFKIFHYFIAVLLGKVVVTSYVLLAGKFTSNLMRELLNNNPISLILFFFFTMILTILVIKIDWKELFEKYYKT